MQHSAFLNYLILQKENRYSNFVEPLVTTKSFMECKVKNTLHKNFRGA